MQILIVGAGISGIAVAKYFVNKNYGITIFDKKPLTLELSGVNTISEPPTGHYDLVVCSPGIDLNKNPWLKNYELTSEVEIFLQNYTGKVIAITGTNGKSTVCDGLCYVLNNLGLKAVSAGNIGDPVINYVAASFDYVILELSSYQLELLSSSYEYDIAALIDLSSDHLDRHGSLENYVAAKKKILSGKKNLCYYQVKNQLELEIDCYGTLASKIYVQDHQLFVGDLVVEHQELAFADHDFRGSQAICAITKSLGLDHSLVIKQLKTYKGLDYRLQLISNGNNRAWYNDSKATNFASVLHALTYCHTRYHKVALILAGEFKEELTTEIIAKFALAEKIYLWGEHELLDSYQELEQIVSLVAKEDLDCVLFSPGGSSFDRFQNFRQRAEYFSKTIAANML